MDPYEHCRYAVVARRESEDKIFHACFYPSPPADAVLEDLRREIREDAVFGTASGFVLERLSESDTRDLLAELLANTTVFPEAEAGDDDHVHVWDSSKNSRDA